MSASHHLDARNLLCPMPVIKLQSKVKSLSHNDVLSVTCTDPGTKHDIPAWCRLMGHDIIDTTEGRNEIVFTIKVIKNL